VSVCVRRQLDFGNNMIGGECMTEMAACLKKNKTLTSLNLYMNDIGDVGMEKLAEALAENDTLETLDVGGNNIRAMGMMVRPSLQQHPDGSCA
jgi:Ran GTPase-activating protein (RanGAP) involved in mRNA processing and transport